MANSNVKAYNGAFNYARLYYAARWCLDWEPVGTLLEVDDA